jgi:hypothetical protein
MDRKRQRKIKRQADMKLGGREGDKKINNERKK